MQMQCRCVKSTRDEPSRLQETAQSPLAIEPKQRQLGEAPHSLDGGCLKGYKCELRGNETLNSSPDPRTMNTKAQSRVKVKVKVKEVCQERKESKAERSALVSMWSKTGGWGDDT